MEQTGGSDMKKNNRSVGMRDFDGKNGIKVRAVQLIRRFPDFMVEVAGNSTYRSSRLL